ncbi:MAG: DinB family protein [Bacteroidota bacterium]|nr:DinB family protein [Bacteroidota bacterium]
MNREIRYTPSELVEILEYYADASNRITYALQDTDKAMWQWKPSEKAWSIHQVLVHLADSEVNSYLRCRKAVAEPGAIIFSYDQDSWATNLLYEKQNADDALLLFTLLRKFTYNLLKLLPAQIWANFYIHSDDGNRSMEDWLDVYKEHDHVNQINRIKLAWQLSQK